jgi:hypothetical protein
MAFLENKKFNKSILTKDLKENAIMIEENAWVGPNKHKNTIMCGRHSYYSHIIMIKNFPKDYLRIIHDKMDKTNTSTLRLHVKLKQVVRTMLDFH